MTEFADPKALRLLDGATIIELNQLPFGVVKMDAEAHIVAYNEFEARLSGLTPQHVIGKHFFVDVAPCTNNYLVAQRYVDEEELDAQFNDIFTYKMKPTKVRLRLLQSKSTEFKYLLVQLRT